MALPMAHSLALLSERAASPVGQLRGGAKSKTRRSAASLAVFMRTNDHLLAKSSAGLSISPFQSLAGIRKAINSAIDSLTANQLGQEFRSVVAKFTAVSKQSGASRAITTSAMFERFTVKAIKAFMLAQEEARRLGHNRVGTEHILLGLIGESTDIGEMSGIAGEVFKSMGVKLKEARVEVEKISGRGIRSSCMAVKIPFTPRAKRVLKLSLEEARQRRHNYICTEHLHLGLLREGKGVAARVLENLGAEPSHIRTRGQDLPSFDSAGNLFKSRLHAEKQGGGEFDQSSRFDLVPSVC